jgi:hypothetical protein
VGQLADAYTLLDAADWTLADVAVRAECVDAEEVGPGLAKERRHL